MSGGEWYDPTRLAIAIAKHETQYGQTGVGKTQNNVCGIRRNGQFESYDSVEEGLEDCTSVVLKYKPWTIDQIAMRWTTTQQQEWKSNVKYFYTQK